MRLSSLNTGFVLRVFASLLVVSIDLPAAAQQRPLTAADFPKVAPKIDESLLKLKGKDLTERILLMPYDGTALRFALGKVSPEFLNGTSADDLIAELSTLQAESIKQILPDILTSLERRGRELKTQRYFSAKPLPPSVSFMIINNELVFFSGGVEFPEVEDGLNPVSSSFGIEKDNKKYFPLKPKKVTDPTSPYKWVYEFQYQKNDGYSNQGKVFSGVRKEVETATIQIWKTF